MQSWLVAGMESVEEPTLVREFSSTFVDATQAFLEGLTDAMASVLFYEILGIPFLVFWLIIGGIFFTFRLGFINIHLFGHAIQVVRGKYTKKDEPGEVSHFQALAAAVSATVGLGNIGGVAIAITMGGPGAVIWMAIAGLFAMSMKFSEVVLGQQYRKISKKGKVSGGAFHYLKEGLADAGLPRLGKVLAIIFAIFCMGGALGGGNMYQANQSVAILQDTFPALSEIDRVIALVLAVAVGMIIFGGIRRIAKVASAVVPVMAIIYVTACIVVLFVNASLIPDAFVTMFKSAFTAEAAGGGIIGALIAGFRRAAFSNESGLGSAPIAHAAAKSNDPVKEGCVALLEPFIDTVVICMMTGLVITVTGVYANTDGDGVVLTSAAFATVVDWFPIVLSVAVVLFAFSTMITWSYYGSKAWEYIFGDKYTGIFQVIFCLATFIGGVNSLDLVITISDLFLLSMAIPNLIGLYILSPRIAAMTKDYRERLASGKLKRIS